MDCADGGGINNLMNVIREMITNMVKPLNQLSYNIVNGNVNSEKLILSLLTINNNQLPASPILKGIIYGIKINTFGQLFDV